MAPSLFKGDVMRVTIIKDNKPYPMDDTNLPLLVSSLYNIHCGSINKAIQELEQRKIQVIMKSFEL